MVDQTITGENKNILFHYLLLSLLSSLPDLGFQYSWLQALNMELCGDTVLIFPLIVEHFLEPSAEPSIFPIDFSGIYIAYLVATCKLVYLQSPYCVPLVSTALLATLYFFMAL